MKKSCRCRFINIRPSRNNSHFLTRILRPSRGILKGSFLSTVRPAVHTNPSQKRKRSSNQWNLKTPALRFFDLVSDTMKKELFKNDDYITICHVICLTEFSSKEKTKMIVVFFVVWMKNV